MLVGLVCNCSGSENRVRDVFRKVGNPNWLSIPVYTDKKGYEQFKMDLPDHIKELDGFKVLDRAMRNIGSYAKVVGFDENQLIYADVKGHGIAEQLKAEVIAEKFA